MIGCCQMLSSYVASSIYWNGFFLRQDSNEEIPKRLHDYDTFLPSCYYYRNPTAVTRPSFSL